MNIKLNPSTTVSQIENLEQQGIKINFPENALGDFTASPANQEQVTIINNHNRFSNTEIEDILNYAKETLKATTNIYYNGGKAGAAYIEAETALIQIINDLEQWINADDSCYEDCEINDLIYGANI